VGWFGVGVVLAAALLVAVRLVLATYGGEDGPEEIDGGFFSAASWSLCSAAAVCDLPARFFGQDDLM
jgi:hypothetical protein